MVLSSNHVDGLAFGALDVVADSGRVVNLDSAVATDEQLVLGSAPAELGARVADEFIRVGWDRLSSHARTAFDLPA